jgi:predicted lipid-binding transport protein (Tim44 family)
MNRSMLRVVGLAAALATTAMPVAWAQTQPPAAPPAGQPAGSQAQERSQGAVGGFLWPLLGLAVIGGVVAAASGGGGGGGGGSSAPTGTQ